jgi:hypothetical protein
MCEVTIKTKYAGRHMSSSKKHSSPSHSDAQHAHKPKPTSTHRKDESLFPLIPESLRTTDSSPRPLVYANNNSVHGQQTEDAVSHSEALMGYLMSELNEMLADGENRAVGRRELAETGAGLQGRALSKRCTKKVDKSTGWITCSDLKPSGRD